MDFNSTSSRSFVFLALLILGLAGCQTSENPKSEPATQMNAEVVRQVSPEKPSLSGEIENLSLYPVPNNRRNLAISLVISVRNTGSPSIAQDWALSVTAPGRTDPGTLEPVHVNGMVEMPGTAGMQVDLAKEDLVIKSKQNPIAKGAQLKGILTFVLPNASARELSNNHATLLLQFKDNLGHSYQTRKATIGTRR
jgi:hypothetical protein